MSEQSWAIQTGDRIKENMDKYGTDRTLFQGCNEVFQIPSNEIYQLLLSCQAGFLPAEGETGRSCGGLLVE